MTARFLLDTNIVSDVVRHPRGRIVARIAAVGADTVATSVIVAAELRYSAVKKNSARLSTQLDAVLDGLEIIPFEAPADKVYGAVRAALEQNGAPIGPNDLLIASQALALGMILVTNNEREFARVKGLIIENWLNSMP